MWDIKNLTENNAIYQRAYFMDGLMRSRLTPDGSKLILCSTNGFLLLIHDLHLETLNSDLEKFKVCVQLLSLFYYFLIAYNLINKRQISAQ